jgi:hypothetical protein
MMMTTTTTTTTTMMMMMTAMTATAMGTTMDPARHHGTAAPLLALAA